MSTCYVVFKADIESTEYAYLCGALQPRPGDYVVITVGVNKNPHLKIVPCVRVEDEDDPRAVREITGLVILQPSGSKPNGLIRE